MMRPATSSSTSRQPFATNANAVGNLSGRTSQASAGPRGTTNRSDAGARIGFSGPRLRGHFLGVLTETLPEDRREELVNRHVVIRQRDRVVLVEELRELKGRNRRLY